MRLYVRKVLIGNEFGLMPSTKRAVLSIPILPLVRWRESLQESKVSGHSKEVGAKAIDMIRVFTKKAMLRLRRKPKSVLMGTAIGRLKKESKVR
jgi:hypothetical protein